MNQKDIALIRRQFKKNNKDFYLSKTAVASFAMESGSPVLKSFSVSDFEDLSEMEQTLYLNIFKKSLSGKLNRQLSLFPFRQGSIRQQQLYELNQSRLKDEEMIRNFMDMLAQQTSYLNGFCITLCACEFHIPAKDRNGLPLAEGNGNTYQFLLCSINELALTEIGLFFDPETTSIQRKEDTDLQVVPAPLDAFLFPSFQDGGANVNEILYYTKTPKKPNEVFIENVLENETPLPYDKQEKGFADLLQESCQEELDLAMLTNLYRSLQEAMKEDTDESLLLEKEDIHSLMEDAGLSQRHLDMVSSIYQKTLGTDGIFAVNTHAGKLDISLPQINISLKQEGIGKIHTRVLDGKQCLVIEMDEAMICNGMELNR